LFTTLCAFKKSREKNKKSENHFTERNRKNDLKVNFCFSSVMGYVIFLIKMKKTSMLQLCENREIVILGVFEMRAEILTTSYWLHVELGKNI
jgi:hypothetical protein